MQRARSADRPVGKTEKKVAKGVAVAAHRGGSAKQQDSSLRQAVERKLSQNRRLQHSIQVSATEDGLVILTGIVNTGYDRISAHNDAWFTPGVTAVDNRLRLRHPREEVFTPAKSSDIALQSRLKDAFRRHPDLDAEKITPVVRGRIATLWGTCDAYWKKLRAQEVAEAAADFSDVLDYLAVVPSGEREDERSGEEAMQVLAGIPDVDPQYVVVQVEPGGVVIVSGTVADERARIRVLEALHGLPGIVGVSAKGLIAESHYQKQKQKNN